MFSLGCLTASVAACCFLLAIAITFLIINYVVLYQRVWEFVESARI
jgi:hypothetical protein